MKILITGSAGQLGRAVNANAALNGVDVINTEAPQAAINTGVKALDITDTDAVMSAVKAQKPDVIINCAAYTAVDEQEKNVELSYKINAIGPRNLAIAANETGAKLVHISTDYVFDGHGTHPYTEFDKTAPASVYGHTKLAGEEFVKNLCSRYFILRTAWLYGEGKNFLKTMLKLSETHDEVSVVDDQVGTPTSADELAGAVLALYNTDNYGLFHATCEGSCSWADFAERIFSLAGKKTKVNRVSSARYKEMNPLSADRPAYSILDNMMLRLTGAHTFADWESALEAYMRDAGII